MDGFHYLPVDTRMLRTGCYLTSIGSASYGKHRPYPRKGHPPEFSFEWNSGRTLADFTLVLIVDGAGEWESPKGQFSEVVAGDVLSLVPGGWHRYRASKSIGWTEKWLCIRGSVLHGFVRAGVLPGSCTLVRSGLRPEMEARLDRLREDVQAEPHSNRSSWGARALAVLLECHGDCGFRDTNNASRLDGGIEKAVRFISESSHRLLRVNEIADHCGVEKRTLERRFARAGMGTLGSHIVRERVSRAEILLSETNLPMKEIAYACGFGQTHRMIYDFRRHRGVTPGTLRRSFRHQSATESCT